jgi:CheY-like chemotaxis protein
VSEGPPVLGMPVLGVPLLVVDDELPIRRLLRISLETNNYRVHEAETGAEALAKAAQVRPEVIILDMNLPDMEGTEVLRRLREWTSTPVIILSVRDADRDKVAALDAGADDYLTKPFSTDELLARLRVARRHAQPVADQPVLTFGDIQIDLARRVVTRKGEPRLLCPTAPKAGSQPGSSPPHGDGARRRLSARGGVTWELRAPVSMRMRRGVGHVAQYVSTAPFTPACVPLGRPWPRGPVRASRQALPR